VSRNSSGRWVEGFRVQGLGFRVGLRLGINGLGIGVEVLAGLRFWDWGLGFGVEGLRSTVWAGALTVG